MAITRERKEELVATIVELLEASNGFTVVNTQGISVPKVEALRRKITEAGGHYMVAKNTLVTKALEQTGWVVPEDLLKGPTAIAFGKDNFPGVAKAVIQFIKDENLDDTRLKITGGVMGGTEVVNAKGIVDISELPTLPELQAQIIGLIVQPAQAIVNILYSAESGVVNVLQAWLDKDKEEGGEAA